MESSSANRPTEDIPIDDRKPEHHNQVEVQMASGELHNVEYVLRHPNREWAFASKVTDLGDSDDPYIESDNLILKVDEIESIQSSKVTTESPEREYNGHPVDSYSEQSIWVYYTSSMGYVSTDNAWKAWRGDSEME